ncbi:MAG: transglycosylase domain-containing protein [Bdellovibrionota bacterium]
MISLRFKSILFAFTIIFSVNLSAGVFDQDIDIQKIFNPTEVWKFDFIFLPGMKVTQSEVQSYLKSALFRQRGFEDNLKAGDYKLLSGSQCQFLAAEQAVENFADRYCLGFINKEPDTMSSKVFWVLFGPDTVLQTFHGFPPKYSKAVGFNPTLLIQVVNEKPLFQKKIKLSETPISCLNGVMAIEDDRFLEHQGFSVTGMARALFKNIFSGKKAQGGSTITQQLVKNYFLTQEKSYSRKLRELILSVRLESKYTKDEILEAYLNVIYMGQQGVWEVRGFGAAAEFYFNKRIQDLSVPECAFLAGVLNSPGINNPWKNPDKAKERRNRVFEKLREFDLITQNEFDAGTAAPLEPAPQQQTRKSVPYFAQAAMSQVKSLEVPLEGLQIFLSLQSSWQQKAQAPFDAVINKFKTAKPKLKIDGAYVAADNMSGLVTVAFGGVDFAKTPFNRLTEARRSIGSTIKPFLYLLALEKGKDPFSILKDEPIEIKLDGKRSWKPHNYDNKSLGDIPLHLALEKSQNQSTVFLANEMGFDTFFDFLAKFELPLQQKLQQASVLGAVDLRPVDVLKMYMTLGRQGKMIQPLFFTDLFYGGTNLVEANEKWTEIKDVATAEGTTQINALLERVISHGTGQSLKGYTANCLLGGKSGTTSDYKDSWFAGLTPQMTAIAWLGDDDNKSTGYTGSNGAAQIWGPITGNLCKEYTRTDWAIPEDMTLELQDEVRVLKK